MSRGSNPCWAIGGYREFRFAYSLVVTNTFEVGMIMETYRDGKRMNEYSGAGTFVTKKSPDGMMSLAWFDESHVLATALDNQGVGKSGGGRMKILETEFDRAMDAWAISAEADVKSIGNSSVGMARIPVAGICGLRQTQFPHPGRPFSSPSEFIEACTKSGAKTCIIVYLRLLSYGK